MREPVRQRRGPAARRARRSSSRSCRSLFKSAIHLGAGDALERVAQFSELGPDGAPASSVRSVRAARPRPRAPGRAAADAPARPSRALRTRSSIPMRVRPAVRAACGSTLGGRPKSMMSASLGSLASVSASIRGLSAAARAHQSTTFGRRGRPKRLQRQRSRPEALRQLGGRLERAIDHPQGNPTLTQSRTAATRHGRHAEESAPAAARLQSAARLDLRRDPRVRARPTPPGGERAAPC